MMVRAVIAIGSNSTRLLVAECDTAVRPLFEKRSETRLMAGLDEKGFFTPESIDYTVQTLRDMVACAAQFHAGSITLFATSASRDAHNAEELAARIRASCGLEMRVISGVQEAEYAYQAVAKGGPTAVFDIGGGSTEITFGKDHTVLWALSAQAGSTRLLKKREVHSKEDIRPVRTLAREALKRAAEETKTEPTHVRKCELYGLGGASTTIAAVVRGGKLLDRLDDEATVTYEQIEQVLDRLSGMTPEERLLVPGIPASRIHHIPHGLCIMLEVMDLLNADRFKASVKTNMDGYLATCHLPRP